MPYCVLSMDGSTPFPGAMEIHSWCIGKGTIARFFASQADVDSPAEFGVSDTALWVRWGRIFEQGDFTRAVDGEVIKMALSDREGFGRRFWGAYALLVYDKLFERFIILSDPCGQFPLFFREDELGAIHASGEVRDFMEVGRLPFAPNVRHLQSFVCHGRGVPTDTGIEGISCLVPGCALIKARGRDISFARFWHPLAGKRRVAMTDPVGLLSDVLCAALKGEQQMLLELSGGLESTTIAVALSRLGMTRRVTAVTYFDELRASSNETGVAAMVAAECQIAHRPLTLLDQLPFAPSSTVPVVAQPATQLCFLAQANKLTGLAPGNTTLVNGHGGDALFLAPPPFGVPIDALAHLRFARSATAIADLSIMYRTSAWVVVRRALAAGVHRYGGSTEQPFSTEVMRDQMVEPPSGIYDHLIAQPRLALQPARRYQLAVLAATLDETVVQARGVGRRPFLPFLSQPIVEMALRSRPEDLFNSDHNRLPVRRSAYQAAKLPNLWRTDKGDTTHSALRGILLHKNHVREMCLDGWCVREGMIDRKEMENVIKRTALGLPTGIVEITRVFAVETFLQGILGLRPLASVASQPMVRVP